MKITIPTLYKAAVSLDILESIPATTGKHYDLDGKIPMNLPSIETPKKVCHN